MHTGKQRDRHIASLTNRQTYKQANRLEDKLTERQTGRHIDKQTERQIYLQRDNQTHRQADSQYKFLLHTLCVIKGTQLVWGSAAHYCAKALQFNCTASV